MSYIFKPMTRADAIRISCWKYEEPYSIYSMDESEDCIVELLNGDYICVIDNNQELIGFLCTGLSARVPGGYAANIYNAADFIDFGLGMKPELTGSGLGKMFVSEGIRIVTEHNKTGNLRLVVATFNTRAVKLYESLGFVKETLFLSKINDQNMEFISMTLMIR
jgi:[ribosomal protein S18]-alanine N-acetyltransferase